MSDDKKNVNTPSWENLLNRKNADTNDGAEPIRGDEAKQLTLSVSGMTCSSCETRIEKTLMKLSGVKSVNASFGESTVRVSVDGSLVDENALASEIERLGYVVKAQDKAFSWKQLLLIGILAGVFMLVLSQSGIFSMLPQVSRNMGYGLLFLTGLLTSVHCVGMCGAINISQSMKQTGEEKKGGVKRFLPGFLYNSGRLVSYTLIGGIVGAIGSAISFSKSVQAGIIIVTGIVMLIMGLNILGVFPFLRKIPIRLPRILGTKISKAVGSRGPFIVGLLNGLMPCGPLQSMQLYALGSGSFISGALAMFFFSLGTIPLLLGVGALSSVLNKKFALRMIKVSAILVFFLGAGMIVRGLSLSGIGLAPITKQAGNIAVIKDNVQYVETTFKSSTYDPVVVYAGIPVKWTIKAVNDEINGCNSPVTVPKYSIRKEIVPGDNLIEFTPREPGKITYTCWMGMITSTITVLESPAELSTITQQVKDIPSIDPGSDTTRNAQKINPSPVIAVAKLESGFQTVETSLSLRGYEPLIVQKGIPVRWHFKADKAYLTGCNYRFMIPDLAISKQLAPGDNIIEFTPDKEGAIPYTCWMRMVKSAIVVVPDISDPDVGRIAASLLAKSGTSGNQGGGCCSGNGSSASAPNTGGCCGGSI